MDIEEVCAVVWHLLAVSPISLNSQMIADEESLVAGEVRLALAHLNRSGLLWRDQSQSPPTYRIKQELNALEWAQAVEAGVNLADLETHARLKAGQSAQDVLKIAATGGVEKNRQKQDKRRRDAHQKWLEGRSATRAAETDLARLVADVQAAFSSTMLGLPDDDEVKKALNLAQEEAQRALQALQASLR